MRTFLLTIPSSVLTALSVLVLGCADRPTSVEPAAQIIVGGDVDSREPRFVFIAPEGFVWSDEHRVWHNDAIRTSVKMSHAARTSFQSVADDFVVDRMLAASMELVTKEIRDVEGRPTLLVHGNRLNASYPQQFCVVAFATSTGCAQLTAIYPAELTDEVKNQIDAALLTSRYEVPD